MDDARYRASTAKEMAMSHIECPWCRTRNHTVGYGMAAGQMGAYTFCDDCDRLIEYVPNLEGLSEDSAKHIKDGWAMQQAEIDEQRKRNG